MMTGPDDAPPRSPPPRRFRRRSGLALLALCLAFPVYYLLALQMKWFLVRGLAWSWELPSPLPWVLFLVYPVAVFLLLPDYAALRKRSKALARVVLVVAGPVLVIGGLLSGVIAVGSLLTGGGRIIHLEDPGVYVRAVIWAMGNTDLDADLWVVRREEGWFERWSEVGYDAYCDWPFEVRKSPGRPRYLVVDSRLRVTALLDLTVVDTGPEAHWRSRWSFQPLEELRREFGEDLSELAKRDD